MSTFPQHWREVALRHISVIPIRNGIGEAAQDQEEGYVRYIRTTDIADLHRLDESKRAGVPLEVAKDALVADDDILMTAAGSLGTSYLANVGEPAAFAGYLVRWRVDPTQCDARYFAWWTSSRHHLDQIATGAVRSTIDNFNASKFRSMRAPLPPFNEQRAIADFLDRETAQIDAMIEAQRDLVTALQMRRLALVVDGVHLGSSPECLPEGWETLPFKAAVSRRFTGEWGTEPGSDEVDVACVRVADFDRSLHRAGASIPTVRSIGADKARTKALRPGDLLLERSGGTARNPVGNIVLYVGPEGALSSNFIECVRLKRGHDPQFWCYLHEAAYSTGFTHQHVKQTTGIQNLDVDGFYAEHFAVPALDEQRRIAEELSAKTSTLDAAIAAAIDVASLLRERREALITAAVTGRIDPTTGIERVDPTTEKEAS